MQTVRRAALVSRAECPDFGSGCGGYLCCGGTFAPRLAPGALQRCSNVAATVPPHGVPVPTRNDQRLVIDDRFGGLPEIVHGGYLAGVLSAALGRPSAEVRLLKPAILGRTLTLDRRNGELVELRQESALLATAAPTELTLDVPLPVARAEAEAASRAFPGFHGHPFPRCFACGQRRRPGDGLRIFPGPVPGRRVIAASWVPDPQLADDSGRVPDELVWAALDCPQIWSLMVHAPDAARVVTAVLETRLDRPVWADEPHVLMAWPVRRESGRWLAGAALIGPDGSLCALGRQTAAAATWGVPLGLADRNTEHNTDHIRRRA